MQVFYLHALLFLVYTGLSSSGTSPPSPVHGVDNSSIIKLYNRLKSDLPNPHIRPRIDTHQEVLVNFSAALFQVVDVDDVKQTITALLHFHMEWESEFVRWNPADYGGLQSIFVDPEVVWHPNIEVENRMRNLHTAETMENHVEINSDGNMKWWTISMITYNCLLDMKGFPFDEHNCTMELIFFKDNVHMIKFDKPSAYFHAHMQRSTKFEITYLEAESIDDGEEVLVVIGIKRQPELFLNTLIYPLLAMSSLMITSLLLPADCEAKLDVQITSALAYSVYFLILSDYIPSYLRAEQPVIANVMITLLSLNTFLIFYTALMLRLINKKHEPNPVLFKVIVFIGKLVLVPHHLPMCNKKTTEVEDLQSQCSLPGKEGNIEGEDMRFIVEWIKSKEQADDCREKWCHVVAVLDRCILIALTIVITVFGFSLSGSNIHASETPHDVEEEEDHH